MKKTLMIILAAVFMAISLPVYASDWGKFGKVMAGIEGLRILTGGNVDVVGALTGINNDRHQPQVVTASTTYIVRERPRHHQRIWVPNKVWINEYVPAHYEYVPGRGQVYIGGHYVQYEVEQGGYWREEREYSRHCDRW